jgi:hypothetical protein
VEESRSEARAERSWHCGAALRRAELVTSNCGVSERHMHLYVKVVRVIVKTLAPCLTILNCHDNANRFYLKIKPSSCQRTYPLRLQWPH